MSQFPPEQIVEAYSQLNELIASTQDPNDKQPQLRRLGEGIYKELSSDSGFSFSGLFARMQYVHETMEAPPEILVQLNRLRILGNKAAHDADYKTSRADWASSVLAASSLLQ